MAKEKGRFYLSGGVANSSPSLSLGGAESSILVGMQDADFSGTSIPGITVVGGVGNPLGEAILKVVSNRFYWDGTVVDWSEVIDTGAGTERWYLQKCDNPAAGLILDIDRTQMPPDAGDYPINVSGGYGDLFPNVTAEQSISGVTQYRCIYLRNMEAVSQTFTLYMGKLPSGPDAISIGTTTTNSGSVESNLADEFTEPAGVSNWGTYEYGSEAGLDLTMGANEAIGIWVKRVVPALNSTDKTGEPITLILEV